MENGDGYAKRNCPPGGWKGKPRRGSLRFLGDSSASRNRPLIPFEACKSRSEVCQAMPDNLIGLEQHIFLHLIFPNLKGTDFVIRQRIMADDFRFFRFSVIPLDINNNSADLCVRKSKRIRKLICYKCLPQNGNIILRNLCIACNNG